MIRIRKEMKQFIITVCIAALSAGSILAQTDSRFGPDSVQCIRNVSLYKEYYKQKNYEDAISPWRYVFNNCPKYSKNIFLNGEKMYSKFIDEAEDDSIRQALVDTLMYLYEKRIKLYGQEGLVKGKMALLLHENRPEKVERINELLDESLSMEGEKSTANVLFRYFQYKTKMFGKEHLTKEQVIEAYDKVSTILDKKVKADGKYAANYKISLDNVETLFDPFASCEDIKGIYFKKVEENPDDTELLQKIVNLLTKKNCLNEQFYMDVADRLHKKEPTPESAANLARMHVQRGNHLIAMDFYNDAINLQTDKMEVANYYLEMAEVEFRQFKNYSKARANAFKAAEARPSWGKPYILIGDLYASSSKTCTDDKGIMAKAVFWAAEDKYRRAKSVDEGVADLANQKIAAYRKYYPDNTWLFQRGLNKGDAIKVECWIQESTTIRGSN